MANHSTERCTDDEVDSIKEEISNKLSTGSVMLTSADKAIVRFTDCPETLLSEQETAKLKVLANNLFVNKTENIVLSETKAKGPRWHSLFTVTLYRNGKGESLRYDMGYEDNGITHCTTKDIRYSDTFREFMFSVVHITRKCKLNSVNLQ